MRPTQITDQVIQDFIVAGLHEDIHDGDHTSLATIPADSRSHAVLKIKDYGVLARVEVAQYIFRHLDPGASIIVKKQDGDDVLYGQVAFEVESNTRALLQADAQVLALAHQGTTQYEAASGKPLGHLVNVAGRQRMLSQRMAKFYLAAMLPVDPATATAEIAKARSEFVSATELLRNAPQATQRIRQELQLADGQWVFFDAALQRMQGGANVNRQVAEVFVASENLLSSMDRVTGMYAALAAA